MQVERHPAPNVDRGRSGETVRGIVLHTNEGSFESTLRWFARTSSRVSAHYLVALDGRIASFADETDTARHAGSKVHASSPLVRGVRNPNLITIGIEFEDGGDPDGAIRTDAQYAAGARLLREIAGRWDVALDRDHVVGHHEIREDRSCPGNLDIDRLLKEAAQGRAGGIVCLLPVRNGVLDLPGYLDAAASWCDAIVALDDGSTDDTRMLLDEHPHVRRVLENPPRATAAGWHDGKNRNRLLEAAAGLAPSWIVSVDADERIPPADAAALRTFLDSDALPAVAYGLRHVRLWGEDRGDPTPMWVYRVFAFDPTYRFPNERLHFNPVPTAIERGAWVRTTLRVLHLGSQDEIRVAQRRRRYAEADPDGEYPTSFGGLDESPAHTVPLADLEPSPSVIAPLEDQFGLRPMFDPDAAGDAAAESERPLLAVLLPVRNGEEDLPAWFNSVRAFADAIVALDDGSTDGTRRLLEGEPLVHRLLTMPRRPDYVEWDDAGNRNALLRAADELRPQWILFLDADERLDADDAAALSDFLETDAVPGDAYGLTVHRMIGDLQHWDRADLVAYRLFAWEKGLRLDDDRLHAPPVPVSIPQARYVPTTLRIMHLASLTPERRRRRFAKYRQADPDGAFQPDYGDLLAEPETLRPWDGRADDMAVVPFAGEDDDELARALAEIDPEAPALSAIVISRDDEDVIERSVRAVVEQEVPEPFEVIVVTSGTDRTAQVVRDRFPDVVVVELDRPALPGEARNAGLAAARGDYVSFPGSHVVLEPGSLAARIAAHRLGYPMVTGTTLNLTDTPAGWASYFLDHSGVLPGRPSQELASAPSHCSYDRGFLEEVGGFPEHLRAGEDTVVNLRLASRGCRAYRAEDVRFGHRSPADTPAKLVMHHFRRGRGLGRILLEGGIRHGRVLTRQTLKIHLVGYLPRRLRGIERNVRRWADPDLRERHRAVRPLVALGSVAALAGTWAEVLKPGPGKLRTLIGIPSVHVAIGGLDARATHPIGRTDVLLVARIEPLHGTVRLLSLPRDLLVGLPGRREARLNEAYFVGAIGPEAATASGGAARSPDTETRVDARAGMRLLARALERTLGARIDGSVIVDFEGFQGLVDTLGGLDVDVPHPIDDEFVAEDGEHFSAHFRSGRQILDGDAALTYARTRKADGDAWRRERHVDLIRAAFRALRTIRSPSRALRVAGTGLRSIRVDLSVYAGIKVIAGLARARSIEAVQLAPPVVRSVKTERGKWVHRGDAGEIRDFARRRWVDGAGADGRESGGVPRGAVR
ncbi:MAG: glycosyltransferase [Actinomycetota bacterium]